MDVARRNELKALAELRLTTLAMNADMKTDNNVRAALILKSCSLTDRRQGKQAGKTQYVFLCSKPTFL